MPEGGPFGAVCGRVEQRGVSMLLASLPEVVRNDMVSNRNMSTTGILYRLFVLYQPGGTAERNYLLRSLRSDQARGPMR